MMEKIEEVVAWEGQEGIGLSLARVEAHKEYEVAKGLVVIQVKRLKIQSQEIGKT